MKIVSRVLLLALFIEGIYCCFRHYDPTPQSELSAFRKRGVVSEDAIIRNGRDVGDMDSEVASEVEDVNDEDYILVLKYPGSEEIKVMRDGSFIYRGFPYDGDCFPNIFLEVGSFAPKYEDCREYLEIIESGEFLTTMRTQTCDKNKVFNATAGKCVEVSEIPPGCFQKCEFKIGEIARSVELITPEGRFDYKTLGYDGEDSDSEDSLESLEEELDVEDLETAVTEGMDVGF